MKPFQITASSSLFMRKYLSKYFGLEQFISSFDLESFSLHSFPQNTDSLESLFYAVRDFLATQYPSIFSLGEEFLEPTSSQKAFFWDTLIALYFQLVYEGSESVSVKKFYDSNLEKCGVKYNSYTGYLQNCIFSYPAGEFLGIQPLHQGADTKHPKRLIHNCFPIQQYALIHAFRKSPYCRRSTDSSKEIRFDAVEFVVSDPNFAQYSYQIQKLQTILLNYQDYKKIRDNAIRKSIFAQKNRERLVRMEQQWTDYVVDQFYNFNTYAQIAAQPQIAAQFHDLSIKYRSLETDVRDAVKNALRMAYFTDEDRNIINSEDAPRSKPSVIKKAIDFLHYDEKIQELSEDMTSVFSLLHTMASITIIPSVLLRPHIINKILQTETWTEEYKSRYDIDPFHDAGAMDGWRIETDHRYDPVPYLANVYIPLVQTFYMQVLTVHLENDKQLDSKNKAISFLQQILIENLDKWEVKDKLSSFKAKGNVRGGNDALGVLFELSRTQYRTVASIHREQEKLDYSRFFEPQYYHDMIFPHIQKELSEF